MVTKTKRRLYSFKRELITKSREAALSAVQVFNNPLIRFKSETFIMLMIVAWTYLLHAYFRENNIEYRYYQQRAKRRRFDHTKYKAFKYWELERCLNEDACPLDQDTKLNLRFLIGLRHEIEHQMTLSLDNWLSGRYQACVLNYNQYIKQLCGDKYALDDQLTYSLQFIELSREQVEGIPTNQDVPDRLRAYIAQFDAGLTASQSSSQRFSYRLLFTRNIANRKGQADRVIEFISPTAELAKEMEKTYVVAIKEVEKRKYLPKNVISIMAKEGYKGFRFHHHANLWKKLDAKRPDKGYGTYVEGQWYWYEPWLDVVRQHCKESATLYQT